MSGRSTEWRVPRAGGRSARSRGRLGHVQCSRHEKWVTPSPPHHQS